MVTARQIARRESDRGDLVLLERDGADGPDSVDGGAPVLELRAGGVFVMDTRETSTERALAERALAAASEPASVLVGGLGLGFTLQAVLAEERVERCVVVEIEQALVDWLRDGTVAHGPALMADARVEVVVADVAGVIATAPVASYDLVLLDVDNGPGYLVHEENAALYAVPALADLARILRPGGVAVIWSAAAAPALAAALATCFAEVSEEALPVRLGDRDEHYYLYLARGCGAADQDE